VRKCAVLGCKNTVADEDSNKFLGQPICREHSTSRLRFVRGRIIDGSTDHASIPPIERRRSTNRWWNAVKRRVKAIYDRLEERFPDD